MFNETALLGQRVARCPMHVNDADAKTVGEYLLKLGEQVFNDADDFSGKRPFGNSGWYADVPQALVMEGIVNGSLHMDDGYLLGLDYNREQLAQAIDAFWTYMKGFTQ